MNRLAPKLSIRATAIVRESLKRIADHPFIVAAQQQTLDLDVVKRWIMCAGRESHSFPYILEAMISRAKDPLVVEILSDNLDDEYGNGDPQEAHFQHYLRLLEELDIPTEQFYQYWEKAGLNLALYLAHNVSMQDNIAIALGYMLINEDMTKLIYSAIQTALKQFYPGLKTSFFSLHVEVDEKHVADLYRAINRLNMQQESKLEYGISIGERGMAVLLDEVYGLYDACHRIPSVLD